MQPDPAADSLKPARAPRARFKILPLVAVTLLGVAVPLLAGLITQLLGPILQLPMPPHGALLPSLYVGHAIQLILALVAIAVLKVFVPADYGLHRPRGRTYIRSALLWGALFGVIMTLVDYAPQLISHTKPPLDYPLTTSNVVGWLVFEGVYVGPTEEIPFRSLLVTYLAATMPGKIRFRSFEMDQAGVVVALIFALLHATNFASRPWPLALGQQIYAFILGVLYAYFLEKSKSIVAPILAHNVSDGVEYALLFGWIAFL